METKMITIPFEVEKAKRIQSGIEEGKIVSDGGYEARIICWDKKDSDYPLVALVMRDGKESVYNYTNKGCVNFGEDCLAEGVVKSVHNIPTQAPQSIVGYYPSLPLKEAADKVGWGHTYSTPQYAYAALIDKVSGKGTWKSNPWVFVYEFELVK